ncbi:Protein of unknown function [Gryllus bimaculatus]|nr:Protein of unknown function [Gryllus bimaculatus]
MDPSTDSTAEAIKNALDALNNTNSGVNSNIEMTECNTVTQQQSDLETQQNRQLQAEQQWKMMQDQQKQLLQYLHEQRITKLQQQQNSQQGPQLQQSSQLQLSSQQPQQNVSKELNILEKNSAKRQRTYDSHDKYSVPVSNRYEIFTEDETANEPVNTTPLVKILPIYVLGKNYKIILDDIKSVTKNDFCTRTCQNGIKVFFTDVEGLKNL